MGPAVFSNFSIDKLLTVDCTGMTGRLFSTVAGIGVQGDGISVVIKGIEILAPIYARSAIEFTQGATLTLEDIEISGGTSVGVKVTAPNASLNMKKVSIADSSASWNPPGHAVAINAANGLTRVSIDKNSQVVGNGSTGVMIAPTGSAKVNTTIIGSAFDGNVIGIRSFPGGSAGSNVTISDTSASNNASGIHASGKSVVSIIRAAIGGNSSYGVGRHHSRSRAHRQLGVKRQHARVLRSCQQLWQQPVAGQHHAGIKHAGSTGQCSLAKRCGKNVLGEEHRLAGFFCGFRSTQNVAGGAAPKQEAV